MNKIFKLLAIISFSLVILYSISAFAIEKGRVNCNLLNLRSQPNTNCEIADRLPLGTTFEIVYTDNGWHYIKLSNNKLGFVSANYVTAFSSEDNLIAGEKVASIVENAHKYIGYPYSYGSAGPSAFDCSGFTSYLFKQQGITLPRSSRDQGSYGTYVDKADLEVGDLLFFSNRKDRVINHVGLYIGNDEFIHASTSLRGVVKDSLNTNYYIRNYVAARRVL